MTHAETNIPAITLEQIEQLASADQAFIYSVQHQDAHNMRLVLRAHGYAYTPSQAERVIRLAQYGI